MNSSFKIWLVAFMLWIIFFSLVLELASITVPQTVIRANEPTYLMLWFITAFVLRMLTAHTFEKLAILIINFFKKDTF